MEATCLSTDKMDKEDVIHMHSGILTSHEKEGNLPSATTWMDLVCTMISEVSQRNLYDLSDMWNRKKLHLLKQRVEWWLPGSRDRDMFLFVKIIIFFLCRQF